MMDLDRVQAMVNAAVRRDHRTVRIDRAVLQSLLREVKWWRKKANRDS